MAALESKSSRVHIAQSCDSTCVSLRVHEQHQNVLIGYYMSQPLKDGQNLPEVASGRFEVRVFTQGQYLREVTILDMRKYNTTEGGEKKRGIYSSNNHSLKGARPSFPFSSSVGTALPTATDVPKNDTSPPSHSANLNSPLPVHSRPPSSDPSSPSPPKLSTPTPPACEVRRLSSSRSRIVRTRLMASCSAVMFVEDLRVSHLCATIANAGGDCEGGNELSTCST